MSGEKASGEKADAIGHNGGHEEVQNGSIRPARGDALRRGLKSRHAQMIAIGGTVGTGLLVQTGQTLARGGPAFILCCYIFMSFATYCVLSAMTEIGAYMPVPGSSVNLYAHRCVSPSLGFALGWLYFLSLGILVPYEVTAAGLVIDYWDSPVNLGVWITIMVVVVVAMNLLPVQYYGETEFWFASIKVITILGLLILSVVLFFGGGPNHEATYFRYWKDPGAANTYLEQGDTGRFVALLSTLVLTSFPFTFAPELIIATAGEMASPRRNLRTAARQYAFRLIFLYVGTALAIGAICPSDDPALTSGGSGAGTSAYVIGMKRAGIKVLDSVVNGSIIIAAWSSANSFFYISSRSLYSLAISGSAPSFFKVCGKNGVPYRAVAATSLLCLLSYLNLAKASAVVFSWFVSLTNTSGFISWTCCCIIYLRFRKACKVQGIVDLPYRSRLQPYGAYFGIPFFIFLTLINGFTVFWADSWSISGFLTAYLGIPVFALLYLGHKAYRWSDPWAYRPEDVDLTSGLDELLAEEEISAA